MLLALTKKGMKREEAYSTVQKYAMDVWSQKGGKSFRELLKSDRTVGSFVNNGELEELFDLKKSIKNVDYIFERVGLKEG